MKILRMINVYRLICIFILVGIVTFSGTRILGLAASNLQVSDFAEIDAYVQKEIKSARIPGLAYGIVKGDKIVHLQAYGINELTGQSITPQTPFLIGSVGKVITSLAIQQLISAGKVELDGPVQRYIPWFRLADEDAAKQITIRQLLTHTSGLSKGDGVNPKYYQNDRYTNEELVRSLDNVRLDRPAGSSQEYSNLNFIILGQVIEQVSGQSYQEYVQENILNPLEMKNTYMDITKAKQAGLTAGHRVLFGFLVPVELPYPSALISSGYHISTVEDMAHILIAHLNKGNYKNVSVLSPNGQSNQNIPNKASYYDIHWIGLDSIQKGYTDAQSGTTLDYSACYYILPYLKTGVIVLTNANTAVATPTKYALTIAFDILEMATGYTGRSNAPSITTVYIAIDLLLLAIMALPVVQIIRLSRWKEKQQNRFGKTRMPFLPIILVNFIFPLILLICVPIIMSASIVPGMTFFGAWPFFFYVLPDISYPLLGSVILCLIVGSIKLFIYFGRLSSEAKLKTVG